MRDHKQISKVPNLPNETKLLYWTTIFDKGERLVCFDVRADPDENWRAVWENWDQKIRAASLAAEIGYAFKGTVSVTVGDLKGSASFIVQRPITLNGLVDNTCSDDRADALLI